MPDTPFRNRSIRQISFWVAVISVLAGLILLVAGLAFMFRPGKEVPGALMFTGGLLLSVIGLLAHLTNLLLLKTEINVNRIHHDTLDLLDLFRRFEPHMRTLSDNIQISDAAKSIAHRERERDMLRQAIREEMYSGDWEAAHYLIDQMERRFGYMQEAKTLRAEINQVRDMTIEEKIGEVISHIDALMNEHKWDRARQEIERLMKLFPRHEKILNLPAELTRRREARKQELLAQWRLSVQRNEIDRGIAILTELDAYLTAQEAEQLRESARDVFKARLLNLGVQFSLAVQEQRWRDALEVGLTIRQEFPNSRMAVEVGEKIDVLRVRAGFVSDAEITHRRAAPMT